MKRIVIASMLIAGLLLGGIAGAAGIPDEQKSLEKAVKTYWEAQVKQDWGALYDVSPPEVKAGISKEQFVAFNLEKNPIVYLSYDVGRVEVSGKLGWADVAWEARAAKFPEAPPRKLREWMVWAKGEGGWYPLPPKKAAEEAPQLPPSVRPAGEEAALAKRVDQFWQAREADRWDLVYQFCDPQFRERVSLDEFLQKKALRAYFAHSVDWTEVSGDTGTVRLTSKYRITDPALSKLDPQEDTMLEKWVKVDGVWYLHVSEQN